jgi:predicted O-methyltransferase YrrM
MKYNLDELAQQCRTQNVPIISNNTKVFLQKFLSYHTIKHYAEIGTAQGYSTIIAAEILQKQGTRIRTREISYPQYKKALSHFARYGYKGITAYYADATHTMWEKFTHTLFDVVFIDAQKSKYHTLLQSIRPHIAND